MDPDWLKFKKYPHIGTPLTRKRDSAWLLKYVTDMDKIAKHKFTPLLHKKIVKRKFRPQANAPKNQFGKRERSVQKPKERPIFYASHLDSIVYSYYSHLLNEAYEQFLNEKPFENSPVAYRRIPVVGMGNGNKCNIEFAFDTLSFIENNKHRKLSVIVADITSFFDNLDHRLLHKQWKRVLDVKSLSEDHYNVYKSLINKRFVNELELFGYFQNRLIVERGEPNDNSRTRLRRKKVKHIWNLRNERVVAFCTKNEFFKEARSLIRTEKACSHQHQRCRNYCRIKGIPQGTPISATLANIYMLDFDEKIFEATTKFNAYYQRYSDDLVIVCDQKDEEHFFELIQHSVQSTAKLEIQREKTNIYRYEMVNDEFRGGIVNEKDQVSDNKQLEYLGFEYDGSKVRVKTVGFSKFYRNMKRTFRRGTYYASKPSDKSNTLYKGRLYKRFTHRGAQRRLIYKLDPSSESGYSKTKEYYWGNYISYLEKANRVMKPINKDEAIKSQSSKFWQNFHKEMTKAHDQIEKRRSVLKPNQIGRKN